MARKYDNVLKKNITKEQIVSNLKKWIKEEAGLVNKIQYDQRQNNYHRGQMEAYLHVLAMMGYEVNSTVGLNNDFTIATVEEVLVDDDKVWAA